MGWLLLFLFVAVAGIVAGVRWVAPWARRTWPAWLVKAVFGSVLVLACWGAPTEPLVAQSPAVVAHEVSDTSAGLRVQWNRPAGDSVQAKTAGCYRVKVNGGAWGRWSCRYLTEPKMAVTGAVPPPVDSTPTPPPVDSQPAPPDTTPTPPPPTGSHEPAGYGVLFANDFSVGMTKDVYAKAGQAGCWFAHSGGAFQGGKYVVTFNVGLAEGRTPNKLEASAVCPPAHPAVASWYLRLDGYEPGDGTPAWVNGEGTKAVFLRSDPSNPPLIFKCDSPQRPVKSGVYDRCLWTLYTNSGSKVAASGVGTVLAGQPNTVECVGSASAIDCWVNGAPVSWKTGLPAGFTGVWLDWTYGGGGGGTPVGIRSVWSLDGVYASGR